MSELGTALAEGLRLSKGMGEGIDNLRQLVREAAEKEAAYRHLQAQMFVTARTMEELKTAQDKKAWVDDKCADVRKERDIADGLKQAELEHIRNMRQQLSFVQTMTRADGEERAAYFSGQVQE